MTAPLSPQREAEIRAFEEDEHRNVLTMSRNLDDLLAELDRVRAELAAKPAAAAVLTEYGIAILDAGVEVVTNVTTDRDQALRSQAHIRTGYPLARLVSRTVSHGEWTEVTS
ncbi:hypothetical protein [Streptomyces sp. NPDC002215]|uniref:hypothetical protein n=1 Tax=Streptomyces sp. NPDC002215 TaxID=3154412 RepID=UPI00332DE556